MLMHWSFSWGWFFGGIAILAAGAIIVKCHRAIAENLASGVQSYDKVKLFGVITCIMGMIFIANIHSTLLYFIFHLIMPQQFP